MSPWLLVIYKDGVVGELCARMLGRGLGLVITDRVTNYVNQLVFVDDTPLAADNENLARLVKDLECV